MPLSCSDHILTPSVTEGAATENLFVNMRCSTELQCSDKNALLYTNSCFYSPLYDCMQNNILTCSLLEISLMSYNIVKSYLFLSSQV